MGEARQGKTLEGQGSWDSGGSGSGGGQVSLT